MNKGRLEMFSDGVIAIIITIMVLELRVPPGHDLRALVEGHPPLALKFACYVLSFVHIAIYWNNHHHLFHGARRINGQIMWANMHLLFWLSLVPFATGWMGETGAPMPTALYGFVMLSAGTAFHILVRCLLRSEGPDSALARAIGRDVKGRLSVLLYLVAIFSVVLSPWISIAFYASVAMIWLIPDRRVERVLVDEQHK
jgi:uncharacterized membrane protein